MSEFRSWRDLLSSILKDTRELERIAHVIQVNPITLKRWSQGEGTPRPSNIRRLLEALPRQRQQLVQLLEIEGLSMRLEDDEGMQSPSTLEIPGAFYRRVMHAHATTPPNLHLWTVTTLIAQQALEQLDPNQHGLAVLVMECLRPIGQNRPVRSLHTVIGVGTAFWKSNVVQQTGLLGSESLSGRAISTGRLQVINDIEQVTLYPFQKDMNVRSLAAAPIQLMGKTAGCLTVFSTRSNYFTSAHQRLLEEYAYLLTVVFEQAMFLETDQIMLQVMPPLAQQRAALKSFLDRTMQTMREATVQGQALTYREAEHLVWLQFEEEFLRR